MNKFIVKLSSVVITMVSTIAYSQCVQAEMELYWATCPKPKVDRQYDTVGCLEKGIAYIKRDSKWGFVDKEGNLITPIKYDSLSYIGFANDFIQVELNGKNGFIDRTGKEVIPLKYDWIFGTFIDDNDLVVVQRDNKYGFIDKTGKEVIPLKYDFTFGFRNKNKVARVQIDNKWGVIDKNGKEIIPLQYDSIEFVENGLAKAKLNNKTFTINKQGQIIEEKEITK